MVAITFSDIVALLALVGSLESIRRTSKFNKRQTEFSETANRLNTLLVEKEQLDSEKLSTAELSANFVKSGKHSYKLKVFNKGESLAENVRIEFPNGSEIVMLSDVERKFPLKTLEPQQSVELIASVHMQSPPNTEFVLTWDDESGKGRSKTLNLYWS